jgi:hypothetical protein
MARMSETDQYNQAVASARREDALAFIREFPASQLVGNLIQSLPAEVALQVCADLSGEGPSPAQDACKKLQEPLAVVPPTNTPAPAPVARTAPVPIKVPVPADWSGTAASVCADSSCTATSAPTVSPQQPAAAAPATITPDPQAAGADDSAAITSGPAENGASSDSADTAAGSTAAGTAGSADAAGGNSAGSAGGEAIPGTDARIGGSLNASGSGNTLDETKSGDVNSTASGNVTGSVGDTRSGSVDGSVGGNVGEPGNGNLDGSIGATVGDPGRATVGGSVGGSVGADRDGRGIDGDMRGGVKARVYF